MYGKDLACVVSAAEEVMFTFDMDLALKTFSECLINNGFNLDDQKSIEDNKDFYISIFQIDVFESVTEHFGSPKDFQKRFNLKSPILFTQIAYKEEMIEITDDDFRELLCTNVGDNYKNFKVIYDDIPDVTNRNSYIEKGGTERRVMVIIDIDTKLEHHINYTYSPEYGSDFDESDTVKIVEDKDVEDKDVDVAVNTPSETDKCSDMIKNAALLAEYKSVDESSRILPTDSIIEDLEMMELIYVIQNRKFSIYELQNPIYEYAIKNNMHANEIFKIIQKHT